MLYLRVLPHKLECPLSTIPPACFLLNMDKVKQKDYCPVVIDLLLVSRIRLKIMVLV